MRRCPKRYLSARQRWRRLGLPDSAVVYVYDDADIDLGFQRSFGETPELDRKTVSLGDDILIEVHAPEEDTDRFSVAPAMTGGSGSEDVLDLDTALRLFVQGLIQRREIEINTAASKMTDLGIEPSARATHTVMSDQGKMVLKRNYFSCGCSLRK